ncbi:MAG: hypothetical protein C7B47_15350 [Sulfobacillus thermosulfidooxidans]|uniref:Recombinase family protein n=1 Tax=Sulfobacillus thermosulfidooxidans TaxID=28034 RepID=A0A2T2WPU3_SULTH|nr:MAG: hypothetical protein C7B47_15350 [Sulfobacillus thermosulfidooxidans]
MRALGVARVSTQEQATGDRFSIPHQRQRITEYCIQRGWDLVDVVEYVQSGGSNYRELQEILARVDHEQIRVVVVNELDRLARDMVSTLLFLEDLQKVGCRFAAVADDLDLTTPDGELKMMILSVFAHYFRKQLARKVKGGLAERARHGKHHGGRPPYGFQFNGDKLEPHPEQAPVVRQIYEWYVHEGLGAREIAKRLNVQGIPTQTGRSQWASTEILRLLRKPANVGGFATWRVRVLQGTNRRDPQASPRGRGDHSGRTSRHCGPGDMGDSPTDYAIAGTTQWTQCRFTLLVKWSGFLWILWKTHDGH